MQRTIVEINQKIKRKKAVVLRADEFCRLVESEGLKDAARKVDLVTTGTFGAMCSSGVWLNFGHSNPPIKMIRVFLNNVEVYSGVAAVDGYLGATQTSTDRGIEYGGAHVIEDLLKGKEVVLRAVGYGSDCYPRKRIITRITLADLNFALMQNPRNAYQRYNAATNSGLKILYTYMGKLLPNYGNVTFSGSGELSPLQKDPAYKTLGPGSAIFLGGTIGRIIGSGTQHSPQNGFGTLMVQGELKKMSPEFIRAATISGYGSTLYVGIGAAIPLLNEEIAFNAARNDQQIKTAVIDYSSARLPRKIVAEVSYAELKSGRVNLNGKTVPAAPLSSLQKAVQIAEILKQWIISGRFLLTTPFAELEKETKVCPLFIRRPTSPEKVESKKTNSALPTLNKELCLSCGQCLAICPQKVFYHLQWEIGADFTRCRQCLLCVDICPVKAIQIR